MPDVRCPKHDTLFTTETDHTLPGKGKGAEHESVPPCHPDCPNTDARAAARLEAAQAAAKKVEAK